MACTYRRGNRFWASYYIGKRQIKKSLGTDNERVARSKLKRLEYELALGDLHVASRLPLPAVLEAFCKELQATRTYKSYKNDFSRLRVFFGPVCEMLKPGTPGMKRGTKSQLPCVDRYAGKHTDGEFLEDITPQVINRFIAARIQDDGWSPKTANLMRQTLHKLFSYAIKHHGFCAGKSFKTLVLKKEGSLRWRIIGVGTSGVGYLTDAYHLQPYPWNRGPVTARQGAVQAGGEHGHAA